MADDMITDAEIAEVMREAGERLTAAQHRADQAEARVAELERQREEMARTWMPLDARGISEGDQCERCVGAGVYLYPSTATWHGGIGGAAMTHDVCNRCWGSGSASKPWPSWRTPAAAAERVAAMEAALREIAAIVELPEVTEESTDCPGCGSMVDWRGDYEPDIGDRIACDECKGARLDEAGMIVRAALARLDAAGGDGDGHR